MTPPLPRAVVAEDDPAMRAVLAEVLAECGWLAEEVATGEALLSRLWSGPAVGLVVADVRLPGRSGLDALASLRRAGDEVPVILVTAFATREVDDRARELGVLRLFDKPFDPDELGALLRRLAVPPSEKEA